MPGVVEASWGLEPAEDTGDGEATVDNDLSLSLPGKFICSCKRCVFKHYVIKLKSDLLERSCN